MSGLLAKSDLGFEFVDNNFIATNGTLGSCCDLSACNIRCADGGVFLIAYYQNLIQFDSLAVNYIQVIDIKRLPLSNAILLSTCLNYSVNVRTLHKRNIISASPIQRQVRRDHDTLMFGNVNQSVFFLSLAQYDGTPFDGAGKGYGILRIYIANIVQVDAAILYQSSGFALG